MSNIRTRERVIHFGARTVNFLIPYGYEEVRSVIIYMIMCMISRHCGDASVSDETLKATSCHSHPSHSLE